MKRGPLHFLGRKNQSLFDTNVKMKDMDNVELVLESSAIPESGTASVRARPTVKHLASSTESFQGFAVPTPKVPLLPPINGPKINGSGDGDHLSNGSYISVPDLEDKEIFVPPPPSVAPPPPPGTFILPPSDFMGDLNTLDLSKLQPPSMPAPKPPSTMAPLLRDESLSNLKPPPMAPPKPPSTSSSGSASSARISIPPPATLPKHPSFAPPEPPTSQQKTFKTPPPKPIRLSSMSSLSNLDSPPLTPAPPPPVQTPTLSTFNPQNTAKLYNIPKTSVLGGYEEADIRPKQMLVLEDSGSAQSSPVRTQLDGKLPRATLPSKPPPKDPPDLKRSLPSTPPPQAPPPAPVKVANKAVPDKPLQTSHQTSPKPQSSPQLNAAAILTKPEESSIHGRKFSPLLDHKLRNLKGSESNSAREGHTTSPLALLMAAKEREKHRSALSRENSANKNERPSATIQPSETSPNSFTVTPRSSSSSSLPSADVPSASPVLSRTAATPSPSLSSTLDRKPEVQKSPPAPRPAQLQNTKELIMPVLPPPPEFDDIDDLEPPPISPPNPPAKKQPSPSFLPPAHIPPPPPKPSPPVAPKLPPPDVIKPKPLVHVKPKAAPPQLPPNLTTSQATLQSILQKKMLEMDKRITPTREADAGSDDWGSPMSDEDNKVPVIPKTPKATPPTKSFPRANQSATLDMRELQGKVASKSQETTQKTATTSNGTQSRHQYGMTFTVRPGTKQPITLVSKGE